MNDVTPVVKQLLIANVLLYIGTNFFGNTAMIYNSLALHSFQDPDFQIWQPITHMFMHAPYPSLSHILFNMVGLYSFGTALEHFWGGKRFLFFYISCGLGAAVIQNLTNQYFFNDIASTAVGASGALYGVIAAFAIMLPNAEMMLIFLPFPIKAKFFVPVLIGLDLFGAFSGFSIFGGGNIAHFAHIGGALTGGIIMFFWRDNKFNHKRLN
ncbi:MAG: hypothetical protein RLZZ312_1672 [Bacteroidota bacterium]|jgi:membrane associated rhomboid family serine protease